jgi:hypothetical protein
VAKPQSPRLRRGDYGHFFKKYATEGAGHRTHSKSLKGATKDRTPRKGQEGSTV